MNKDYKLRLILCNNVIITNISIYRDESDFQQKIMKLIIKRCFHLKLCFFNRNHQDQNAKENPE